MFETLSMFYNGFECWLVVLKPIFDIRKHLFSFQYTLFDQSYIPVHDIKRTTIIKILKQNSRKMFAHGAIFISHTYCFITIRIKKMKSGGILTFKIVGVGNNKKYIPISASASSAVKRLWSPDSAMI
jgi:hypothetical protein